MDLYVIFNTFPGYRQRVVEPRHGTRASLYTRECDAMWPVAGDADTANSLSRTAATNSIINLLNSTNSPGQVSSLPAFDVSANAQETDTYLLAAFAIMSSISSTAYSANYSAPATGPITSLPGTTDTPLGSANAPRGPPQFPNLLSGYAVRPPWMVAGVDYALGIQPGTVLQDPSTIDIPGVTVDTASHKVTVSRNNATISGIDFSLGGGWSACRRCQQCNGHGL